MSGSARIQTIDAVALLANALRQFGEDANVALIDLDLEMNRALDWIQRERRDYWEAQVRRAWEQINEARAELDRCLRNVVAGQRPSGYEERKALERAKLRLRKAEEKIEIVRRWAHTADRESLHYRVSAGQLSSWIQVDLPQALATLDRMRNALESYVAGAIPTGTPSATDASATPAETPAADGPTTAEVTPPPTEGGPTP
jgi:hypothetical protein